MQFSTTQAIKTKRAFGRYPAVGEVQEDGSIEVSIARRDGSNRPVGLYGPYESSEEAERAARANGATSYRDDAA